MKKFLPYILILIVLAGVFSPVFKVSADGKCVDDQGVTVNLTQDLCKLPAGTWIEDPNPSATPADQGGTGSYHLLQPLPGVNGGAPITDFNPSGPGKLGAYINLAIRLFIGLCAVAALLVIVISGIQYSASELLPTKEQARSRIIDALIGLVIALAAYTILYTINPDILNTEVDIGGSSITSAGQEAIKNLKEFTVSGSGPQTIDGKPVKINFKAQACPAAYAAASAYGIRPALVLAIFDQETSAGGNTGKCNVNNSSIDRGQIPALQGIANKFFGGNINSVPMSCAPGDGTHGGAIGLMQFLPATWKAYGSGGNPWNVNDAMMGAAAYLKAGGAPGNEKLAACKYISGTGGGCGSSAANIYGTSVINKEASYQAKIDAGGCNP